MFLGAGLDTQAYRLVPPTDARAFEIDLPASVACKRQRPEIPDQAEFCRGRSRGRPGTRPGAPGLATLAVPLQPAAAHPADRGTAAAPDLWGSMTTAVERRGTCGGRSPTCGVTGGHGGPDGVLARMRSGDACAPLVTGLGARSPRCSASRSSSRRVSLCPRCSRSWTRSGPSVPPAPARPVSHRWRVVCARWWRPCEER
ncbi:class I SAM-dependent methyltransferase [Streptomyces sp. NEAU-H22]|uniref:class I SAM-dependent methyltransferase n=1 Tax=Streptomyces sp. NEAU-H22 TaxID=2994655 RepID=UPI002250BEDF|nr:class I SAM-dependent methyltransferase [Streptomyces sp. NEAU-H22]MCX3287305.1 class I SAM-dependent methyltransferase [Streptomyces sp. NEAU-H22]